MQYFITLRTIDNEQNEIIIIVCIMSLFQPASARGIGVRVVHRWNQIPKKRPVIVQRYDTCSTHIRSSYVGHTVKSIP